MNRQVPVVVERVEELEEWRDQVQSDPDIGPALEYLLLKLSSPDIMDRDVWRVTWSMSRMIEKSGKSKGTIHKYREDILGSKYLRRSGTRVIETGRGEEERDTYALVLPPSV